MGSVKDLIREGTPAVRFYAEPTIDRFGVGCWQVSGRYSVGDLKKLIPDTNIPQKAEALTMTTGAFFEWQIENAWVPTCYIGVLDRDNRLTTVRDLVKRGDLSSKIVMKLAHVPDTYCGGDLDKYRADLISGKLQCGVADVESIFRKGFPLGSSTFEKIFGAVGRGEEYLTLATYKETVEGLDSIRNLVEEKGLDSFPKLKKVLEKYKLGNTIPNPGFVLKGITYDSTSKFEHAGDRALTKEEEAKLSGLDEAGYIIWSKEMFPRIAASQIAFCNERGILNIDGKGECVAHRKRPVLTDFVCNQDENRLMIETEYDGVMWAIPSNKEIQRAIFRREGIYAAIDEAKRKATGENNLDAWRDYLPNILQEKKIDLKAVSEYSCNLMENAIAEVANRILGQEVFEAKPLELWVGDFLPYASKITHQE
jgi:phosphoribosylaminoimidazole-succinocarboxamide synthase